MRCLIRTSRLAAVLLAALAFAGCDRVTEWRQRVTVEVETPQGVRTGSTVQWAKLATGKGVSSQWGASWKTDGEAVVVDVRPDAPAGEPRYLFALLIGNKVNQYRGGSWGALGPNALEALVGFENVRDVLDHREPTYRPMVKVWNDLPLGVTGEAKGKALPAMVTFADVDDPRTVKVLDPMVLDEAFGPGVRLKRVTITKTDEPVTVGKVEAVLDWIRASIHWRGGIIQYDGPARHVGDVSPEGQLSPRHFVNVRRMRGSENQ